MSTISTEQAKDLRNAFECWQEDYDPVEDKEQYDMFGLGVVAMDELLALRKERERAEPVGEVVDQPDGLVMDGTVHLGGSGTHRAIKGLNKMKRMPLGTKFYTARPAPVVPDCLQRLLKHAEGLTFGSDWNNGTAAKYHRDALIQAVKDCRAAMLNQSQPVAETDTTSQQFESLASVKQPSSIDAATGKASRDSDANSSPDSQATIKQSDGWIPCSERIPEEGGRYWCYVEEINSLGKSHYQWNCSWNGEDWGGEGFYGRVTHWQPLPEPPCK